MWGGTLKTLHATSDKQTIDVLTRRFRIQPGQIYRAVEEAVRCEVTNGTESRKSGVLPLSETTLLHAVRSQCPHGLSFVSSLIDPHASWADLVLPDDTIAQLRELCLRVDHHDRVFHEWAFARKLTSGRGNTALFAGPSGTGKTMAAEVVAN